MDTGFDKVTDEDTWFWSFYCSGVRHARPSFSISASPGSLYCSVVCLRGKKPLYLCIFVVLTC